jgi:hypothetical protein
MAPWDVKARSRPVLLSLLLLAGSLLVAEACRAEPEEPTSSSFDVSLYFLGVAMTGDVAIGSATADLNVGFDEILDHLEFGVMGFGRYRRDPWVFKAEFLYMGLGASKDAVSANFDQWVAEPSVAYQVSPWLEPLVGVRYNSLSGEILGPFGRVPSGDESWWDLIVGATASAPLSRAVSLRLRGDVGGFGIGSDLTWQAHPYVDWSFMQNASLQAGYRWLDVDYETGNADVDSDDADRDRFRWDVLNQGPQVGVTVRLR